MRGGKRRKKRETATGMAMTSDFICFRIMFGHDGLRGLCL